MRGKLIVVEGLDGSGKTTHSQRLAKSLNAAWFNFPQRSTFFGKFIDAWLKGEWSAGSDDLVNEAVFQALQTVNRLEVMPSIESTLAGGQHVVCDRFWQSGAAYGAASGLPIDVLVKLYSTMLVPDVNLLLDIPVEESMRRVKERGGAKADVYESKGVHFYERVHFNYASIWALPPSWSTGATRWWTSVKHHDDVEETANRVFNAVRDLV